MKKVPVIKAECIFRQRPEPRYSFAVSEIINRIHNGHVSFNTSNAKESIIVLWWPLNVDDYTQGWFNLRLFTDTCSGYLIDRHAPFELVRDVPVSRIYKKLEELLAMAKMADDPRLDKAAAPFSGAPLYTCDCRQGEGYFVDARRIPARVGWHTIAQQRPDDAPFDHDAPKNCRRQYHY